MRHSEIKTLTEEQGRIAERALSKIRKQAAREFKELG
jgi:hypothetical protein